MEYGYQNRDMYVLFEAELYAVKIWCAPIDKFWRYGPKMWFCGGWSKQFGFKSFLIMLQFWAAVKGNLT